MRLGRVSVAVLAAGLGLAACDGGGVTTSSYRSVREAIVRSNGRTIVAEATWGGCQPQPHLVLRGGARIVRVALEFPPPLSGNCTTEGRFGPVTATLASRLRHRRLVQLTTGKAVPTVLAADLPTPHALPPGYRLSAVLPTVVAAGLPSSTLGATQTYQRSPASSPDLVLADVPGEHLTAAVHGWRSSEITLGARPARLLVDQQSPPFVQRAVAWTAFGRTLELVALYRPGQPILPQPALLATARSVRP